MYHKLHLLVCLLEYIKMHGPGNIKNEENLVKKGRLLRHGKKCEPLSRSTRHNNSFRMSVNGVPPAEIHGDCSRTNHLLRSPLEIQLLAHKYTRELNCQGQLDADG
jgi:hypothetical protein